MITAVDPDLNILELEFDDCLCKPIYRETLVEALENHLDPTARETAAFEEFLSIVSKVDVPKTELPDTELDGNEEYRRLQERAGELIGSCVIIFRTGSQYRGFRGLTHETRDTTASSGQARLPGRRRLPLVKSHARPYDAAAP